MSGWHLWELVISFMTDFFGRQPTNPSKKDSSWITYPYAHIAVQTPTLQNCLQHLVFPGGHPSKYSQGSMLLNFSDQTRTGVFNMIWPKTWSNTYFGSHDSSGVSLLLKKEQYGCLGIQASFDTNLFLTWIWSCICLVVQTTAGGVVGISYQLVRI